MSLIDRLQHPERMDALIRRKATGNPRQLADRFGVSPRSVANILDELRQLGAEIEYCRYRNSYFYRQPIRFQFNLVVSERDSDKIAGGSKKMWFLISMQNSYQE